MYTRNGVKGKEELVPLSKISCIYISLIDFSRADRAAKFQREKEEREQERVAKQEAKSAAKQEEEVQKQAVKR